MHIRNIFDWLRSWKNSALNLDKLCFLHIICLVNRSLSFLNVRFFPSPNHWVSQYDRKNYLPLQCSGVYGVITPYIPFPELPLKIERLLLSNGFYFIFK